MLLSDIDYMNRALSLAERGRGRVEPNPLVGAVIVRDGVIVGEGWHNQFGHAHAEVNALAAAGSLSTGGTLYVTLEPCNHFGKTPPCTEAVIRGGIRRVVAAMLDPFPQVAGQGAARLREAGIDVEVGVGEVAAHHLNAPYLKVLRAGRPFVHAKWAMSLDGKIATFTGDSKWISGEESRRRVHQQRGTMDAILIGKRTLLADDPLLTARPAGPRQAVRIVLTVTADAMPQSCRLLDSIAEAPVLVITSNAATHRLASWRDRGAEILGFEPEPDGSIEIKTILTELGKRGMTNILVEGGAEILGRFADAQEIDAIYTYVSPKIIGGSQAPPPIGGRGIERLAQALTLIQPQVERLGEDVLIHGLVSRPR